MSEENKRKIIEFFEEHLKFLYSSSSTHMSEKVYKERVEHLSKPAILALEVVSDKIAKNADLAALIKLTRRYLFDREIEKDFGNGRKFLLSYFKITEEELIEASERLEKNLIEKLGNYWLGEIYKRIK